jgi:hypothetical protein
VSARGGGGRDTTHVLYTTGWSFSAEMAIRGGYEKTVGRAFERWRGPGKTAEDGFAARDVQAYAEFLHQTPWYAYPFGSRLVALWRETPLRGTHAARKIERRAVMTVDYGVKAVYAALMHSASNTALAASDLDIQTVVTGLDASDTRIDPRIEVVRELGGGRTLIRTPRYQAYTDVLVRLARRGRDVVEIAGNRRILVTVVAPPSPLPSVAGARELFDVPIQSRPDRRRVALDVSVERLAEAIRTLERAGIAVEHVYDY